MEGRAAEKDDDLYHFISYVPIGGKLYELDGLKEGPICLGECDSATWLDVARPEIQKRIEQYSTKEIRFNLMAIIRNRAEAMREEGAALEREKERAIGLLQSRGAGLPSADELELMLEQARAAGTADVGPVEPGAEMSVTPEHLRLLLAVTDEKLAHNRRRLRAEEDKFAQWKIENVRRKHNYVPFILNFLKILAQKGELAPLVEKARAKAGRSSS